MIDPKVETLVTLAKNKSYTDTAQELKLTQPAVSHHIRQLEEEFGIRIFNRVKNKLKLTPEGEILLNYAHRLMAISNSARQAIEDSRKNVTHLNIGVTQTISEIFVPQIVAIYCNSHPDTYVNISTDSVKALQNKLKTYELDVAVVDGNLSYTDFKSVLLDTDYLCLIVSKEHKLAKFNGVTFDDIKDESFIMRPKKSGTRTLFGTYLTNHFESIKNLKVIIEIDNVSIIKELVSRNLGISIVAHSVCAEDERQGKLSVIPIQDSNMVREINMVHHKDFIHHEILEEFKEIYNSMYTINNNKGSE